MVERSRMPSAPVQRNRFVEGQEGHKTERRRGSRVG